MSMSKYLSVADMQRDMLNQKDARIAELEAQLDATLMELAETQALELQHGAVIERLMIQLAEVQTLKAELRESRMQSLSDLGQAQDAWEAQKAAEAEVARLRAALENLLDAILAQDRHGDRSLTITGSTANLKWLLEAEDDARTALTTPAKDDAE